MWYQRATIRSIYGYHVLNYVPQLSKSSKHSECLFLFKGGGLCRKKESTKESFFMFSNKFYKQIYGVAMRSPLSPALANIFMSSFESKWLKDCPRNLEPVLYRRYVDDIFVLFSSIDQAEKFKKYLSSKHPSINFS